MALISSSHHKDRTARVSVVKCGGERKIVPGIIAEDGQAQIYESRPSDNR